LEAAIERPRRRLESAELDPFGWIFHKVTPSPPLSLKYLRPRLHLTVDGQHHRIVRNGDGVVREVGTAS
jgi:hypothetical protein